MASSYPGISPYVAFANNPILFIDPNGGHNVVYIVNLQNEGEQVVDADEIVQLTQQYFETVGLETTVVLFDPSKNGGEINPNYMDPTDAVILIGALEDVKSYAREQGINKDHMNVQPGDKGWEDKVGNPETSVGSSNLTMINTNVLKETAKNANNSPVNELVAFTILHGFGFSMGLTYDNRSHDNIMAQGDMVQYGAESLLQDKSKTLGNIIYERDHTDSYKTKINDQLMHERPWDGTKSKDNYLKNKVLCEGEGADQIKY